MDSRDPSPTPDEVPEAPPAKKKRKSKRAYSRKLRKGVPDMKPSSNTADTVVSEAEPSAPAASASTSTSSTLIRSSATSASAATRKWTAQDYKNELKRACQQISQLENQLARVAHQLEVCETKRVQVKDAHDLLLKSRREFKKNAAISAKEVADSTKALEDAEMELQEKIDLVKKKCKVCYLFALAYVYFPFH